MFKKGDLVKRRSDCLHDPFWNIRSVREFNGVEGIYHVVRDIEKFSLVLEGLTQGFDTRKFELAMTFKPLEEYM